MRVTIKITGNPGAAILAKIASIKSQANDAVQFAGLNCEGLAKQLARVDTGRFRAGYTYTKTSESSCTVSNAVKYALDLELGHHSRNGGFVGPFPSLLPAFQQAKKECLAELKAIK
ncbi:MAG: hypothetical protein ACRDHW_02520 [Ktedonobacteraceae bacterium]